MSVDFATFARAYGVLIGDLYPSDRIRRCGTEEHPHSKNGAFLYDGTRGWVQAWDGDCEVHWWDDPDRKAPTQAEKDAWAARKVARDAAKAKLWGQAAVEATDMMRTAVLAEHNYLHRKKLGDIKGLVLPDGKLFVPMSNMAEALVGGQLIWWREDIMQFEKKYLYGSRPSGAMFRIGPKRSNELVLCEGYATGLSINKALIQMHLSATILVCFNDANMVNIANITKEVKRRYVFADNDKSGAGERAAQATGLPYCMSPVVGEDANDLYTRAGVMDVMKLINKARRLEEEEL